MQEELGEGSRATSHKAVPKAVGWLLAATAMALLGLALGIGGMGAFDAAFALIKFIWINGWQAFPTPLYPVLVCTAAGTVLSLVVTAFGKPERPMEAVGEAAEQVDGLDMAASTRVGIPRSRKRPVFVRLIDFFVPLAGGGPVGVAMGMIGLITAGCSHVKSLTKRFCERLGLLDAGTDFSKGQKTALYSFGIVGGIIGLSAVADIFGVGMMIPRVEASKFSLDAAFPAIALSIGGWALGLLYLASVKAARALWARAGRFQKLLPLACGIILGLSMALLPHSGLPGSDAYSYQLLGEWIEVPPAILVLTALIRTVLIGFLLNLGWSGGPFLPLIYSALCLGLGISGFSGLEAGTCVAAAVSGILVAFTGQPLMGVAAFMCCPLESLPVVAIATIVATVLPRPTALKGDFAKNRDGQPSN